MKMTGEKEDKIDNKIKKNIKEKKKKGTIDLMKLRKKLENQRNDWKKLKYKKPVNLINIPIDIWTLNTRELT